MHRKTFIIDFFNVFSDYRETLYSKTGVDFHKVKYDNLEKDTLGFFDLFFMDYISLVKIPIDSDFIFVIKRIYNYDEILVNVLMKYNKISIKFILVNDRYNNLLIDQNKDDYLCQYLLTIYSNSVLVSNDRYRNKRDYTGLFFDLGRINVQILEMDVNDVTFYIIDLSTTKKINSINFDRVSVPKCKFHDFKLDK